MTINLFGTIVSNDDAWFYEWFEAEHTTPKMIIDQLQSHKGKDVEMYINSPGGDVWAGSVISSAIAEHGRVIVKVVGIAASAASLPLCSAAKVLIAPTAQIMIHRSSTLTAGNKNDIDQTSQMLNSVDEGMVNAYEKKTGLSREEIINYMDKTTYFDAKRAVELGFADEIMVSHPEKVSASAAMPLMSSNMIDSFKQKLISANLLPGEKEPRENKEAKASAFTKNNTTPKEGEKKMDMNQLKSEHPELFAQIAEEAERLERERVSSLIELTENPGTAEFAKEAIANGGTAESVAVKFMQASMKRNGQEAKNRDLDAEDSNVNKVNAEEAKTPDQNKAEEKNNRVNSIIEKAKNFKTGGRK